MQKFVFIFVFSISTLFTAYIDAAPVYIAKDSRAYHCDRNCSDLSTNDLIEFASPQKADDAGAIPCKHCNSSDIIMIDKEKQSSKVINTIQTEINSNEGVYFGDLKDGKKHGQGTMTWPDGKKYVGEWKDDRKHGQGTITSPDGSKYYIGEWKDDKQNGQGTSTFHNGGIYVGKYKDGALCGQGTVTWPDGTKYVGEFRYGKIQGQGTKVWPNGNKFVGVWEDRNNMHGQGTYTWPDGTKYIGGYRNGKMHGQGTYTYADGEKYVGKWKDGERHDSSLDKFTSKSSNQTSVYSTKNSRTYHKRSCSELNTSDLVEFKSSDYADSAGAIPCKKCNQLAVVERKSSGGNTGVVEKTKQSSESILSQHMKEYGSETSSWMTDKKTGCKFWNPKPRLNESISWSGECVNGKAHGIGILRWYINGIEVSLDTITAKNGVTMINGVMMADVKISNVVFNLSESDNGCVIGDVKKEIDLSNYYVVMDILKKSVLFKQKKNPKKIPNYSIIVILNQGGKRVVYARSYEKHKLTLNEYSNDAYSKRLEKEEERKKKYIFLRGQKAEKQAQKIIKSFDIRGIQVGMTAQKVQKLFPEAGSPLVPYGPKRLGFGSSSKDGLVEVFLSDLSNVYKVKLTRSFDSYVLPSKLLSKLQEKYGNWTDSYKYCCQKSNKIGSECLIDDPAHKDCEGTYNVLWATKFDLLNDKGSLAIGKVYLRAVIDMQKGPHNHMAVEHQYGCGSITITLLDASIAKNDRVVKERRNHELIKERNDPDKLEL